MGLPIQAEAWGTTESHTMISPEQTIECARIQARIWAANPEAAALFGVTDSTPAWWVKWVAENK